MRIRRSRLTADYVQIPNRTVRDDRLSYTARGILAELLSRPREWEATADYLWRHATRARGTKGESRRAMRAAFAELKSAGYLVASRGQLENGYWGTVLTVYDVPQTDVPHAGTSVPPGHTDVSAGRTDVPHAGTSEGSADVPHAGTSVPPGQRGVSAGRTDVPPTDVPPGGTSNRKQSKKTVKKTEGDRGDGRRPSAGGFARAGAREAAGAEANSGKGGTAAVRPKQAKRKPTRLKDARLVKGEAEVFEVLDATGVVKRGSRPPTLRKAVRLLLGHDTDARDHAFALYPRRPEHALARLNRGWYAHNGPERSAADYIGPDKIRRPVGYLAEILTAQDCARPDCELGVILGTGEECRACGERAAQRAGEQLAVKLAADTAAIEAERHLEAEDQAADPARGWPVLPLCAGCGVPVSAPGKTTHPGCDVPHLHRVKERNHGQA